MRPAAGLVLALLSTSALSYGFYLQHLASGRVPALSLRRPIRSLHSLFASWRWLAGFTMGLGGWGLYIAALAFTPISLVQATSAGGVGLLALLARRGGTTLSRQDLAAVTVSVGGLLVLGLSLAAGTARQVPPGWVAPAGWVAASAAMAGAAVFPGAERLRPGAGLGAASGLLYAAGDVATKAAVDHTGLLWLFAPLVLATHGLAFVALQLAFQRGSALATAGVSTLLTNALPIFAGLIVFGEQLPAGWAGVLRALGFTATVAGAALLAASNQAGAGNLGRA